MTKKTVREYKKAEILQRAFNGERIYILAEEYGYSVQAIYSWIKDKKGTMTKEIITKRTPTFKPLTDKEIEMLNRDRSIMLNYNNLSNFRD